MLKRDSVKFYGNANKLAAALDIEPSAISRWKRLVPMLRALQLERLSAGKLKYDQNVYLERK